VLYVAASSAEALNKRAQRIIVGVAAQAGVALESALLYAREKRVATVFQRSLLPTSDLKVEGLEICTRYHPGAEGMQIGGDWFDVIARGDSRVGLAVGDVMGHGVQAAASMGHLRYAFRALLAAGRPPAEALAGLNRIALDDEGIIATVLYVELDGKTGAFECWSAGHLPPLIAEAGGGHRFVTLDSSPLLGAISDHSTRSVADSLGTGDLLLLYTDGLIERRGEALDVSMERLAASLPTDPMTIDDLCDQLYELVATQGDESDDTAIVGVRRL
jgi:serine phosphatase RsbU (regulator of sigma subunit)